MTHLQPWPADQQGPSVLIVLMGSIGDVVRGLALVDELKAVWPGARISWLVEPLSAPLVEAHPNVSRLIVFPRKDWLKEWKPFLTSLRKEHYDIVLDLQRHFKSGLFSFLTRHKRSIGFHRRNAKEGNWLFHKERIPYADNSLAKLQHYLLFLKQLGITPREKLSFGLEGLPFQDLPITIREKIGGPAVGVVLGSSWESKDWPYEGYLRLIKRLVAEATCLIVLLGDRSKIAMAAKLEQDVSSARIVNLAGQTSLVELAGVLRSLTVGVGPDSGPGHLSSAVGTKYVALFGPTPAARNAPYGSDDLVVSSVVGCSPCLRRKCPGLGGICMRLISPDSVFEIVAAVLKKPVKLGSEPG